MQKPSVRCALIAAMVAKHRWGTPIDKESLLTVSAIEPNEYPEARTEFEKLREASYTINRGKRGIELDTSEFGTIADALYYDCGWEAFEIKLRLKHYEGWQHHDWA